MNWERFFTYLGRFNTVAIALLILVFGGMTAWGAYQDWTWRTEAGGSAAYPGFGDDAPPGLPITGQEIKTANGTVAAYYQTDENDERLGGAGLTLIDVATGKSLMVGAAPNDAVIKFEIIHDQSRDDETAIGYIASVADEEQYRLGRTDFIVGSLTNLSRNIVARNVRYTDLPTVNGNGTIGVLLWPEDDQAQFVAVRLSDGAVITRTSVPLPAIRENTLSKGPGRSSLEMRNDVANSAEAPKNVFAF